MSIPELKTERTRHNEKAKEFAAKATKQSAKAAILTHRIQKRKALKTKPLRVRALEVAQSLVGIMEVGGNNMGPMVETIIKANGGVVGEPWCGDFDAYCYRTAGSTAVQRAWAAAWSIGRLAGMHEVTEAEALPGDLVVYTWQHTGVLEKKLNYTTLQVIEGNTGATGEATDSLKGGDGVGRRTRATSLVMRYVRVEK